MLISQAKLARIKEKLKASLNQEPDGFKNEPERTRAYKDKIITAQKQTELLKNKAKHTT
jgi:hypothetical protein